jgi:hypothetical protein
VQAKVQCKKVFKDEQRTRAGLQSAESASGQSRIPTAPKIGWSVVRWLSIFALHFGARRSKKNSDFGKIVDEIYLGA